MPRALLFDLDGTLIDSDPLHMPVFVEMYAARGKTVDHAYYMRHIHGRLNQDSFGRAFPDEDADALSDEKERLFRGRLGDNHPPMPGLPALLDRAARDGFRIAVVTNAPRENVDAMLRSMGVWGRFDAVVTAAECRRGKPDPAPYLEAMRRLEVSPDTAIAFEDSPSGLAAAVAAGVFAVGIRSSLTDAALRAEGAAVTIKDFTDPALEDVLARLKGQAE